MSDNCVSAPNYHPCKCVITNVRSLCNKFNEFQVYLNVHSPDIVAVSESWLDPDLPSSLFVDTSIFWCFRKDRCSRGGGVLLLLKRLPNLFPSQVVLPDEFVDLDILAVDIRANSAVLPFRLVVVYRPPSFSRENNECLLSALDWLGNGCARFCVMGDFNMPLFDWDQFLYPENFLYNSFANFICTHGLTQFVQEPTRGDSILDLLLCSDVLCVDDVDSLPPIANSDHSSIAFRLSISLPDEPVHGGDTASRRNFAKADWDSLCSFLATIDWHTVCDGCVSTEELWNNFMCVIDVAIDKFVPLCIKTKHASAPVVYPKHIRKLFAVKKERWRLYRHFRTPQLKLKYTQAATRCTIAVSKYTTDSENRLVESENLGLFYKYVNRKLNGSHGIAPLRDKDGNLVSDDISKANLLK